MSRYLDVGGEEVLEEHFGLQCYVYFIERGYRRTQRLQRLLTPLVPQAFERIS